jgi:hypothetical protein
MYLSLFQTTVVFGEWCHAVCLQELSECAIQVLSCRVRLDHAVQSAAEQLKPIDIALSKLTLSLSKQVGYLFSTGKLVT